MTDWDYEERIINDRYSGYKASSRIWELRADHRLELLKEVRQLLDKIFAEDIVSSGDLDKVYEKIVRELGEELQTIELHIKSGGEPDAIIQSEEELGDD